MPRRIPDLQVYANPWHGPLDHNHRASSAVPWDPKDNPGRVSVGAHHRLDDDGELYFEFDQYEGTHSVALASLTGEAKAKRAQELIDNEPETLVLRANHAPVRVPNTLYFLQALRTHALLPADLATYVTAFGRESGFQPIEKRVASLPKERADAHEFHFQEKPDPKPRPAHGAGRLGMQHAHRPLSAVIAAPTGTAPTEEAHVAAARAALAETSKRLAEEAAKKTPAGQTSAPAGAPTTTAPKGQ
jgi:hypothetical protein